MKNKLPENIQKLLNSPLGDDRRVGMEILVNYLGEKHKYIEYGHINPHIVDFKYDNAHVLLKPPSANNEWDMNIMNFIQELYTYDNYMLNMYIDWDFCEGRILKINVNFKNK